MPAPERYDVSVYERASLNLALTVYTDDDGVTLWSLTGYTAAFRIMDKPSGSVIATLTDGSGVTLGGSAGTILVKRTPAQVQALKLDKGAYDLVITAADGTGTLLLQGDFSVVKT
jgi:hypothetical protein